MTEIEPCFYCRNFLKTDTALKWEQPEEKTSMKSIFDMEYIDLLGIPGVNRFFQKSFDTKQNARSILCMEPDTDNAEAYINENISINNLISLKILIDHQVAYLKEKKEQEKSPEPQEFKVGWVYEDGNQDQWLIIRIEDESKTDFPLKAININYQIPKTYKKNGWIQDTKDNFLYHLAQDKNNLIHSTGKKWEI